MNAIQKFEKKHMAAFVKLSDLEKQAKTIEQMQRDIREELTVAMDKYGIESIDNDYIKIIHVSPSESKSLDTKKLRAERPEIYNSLMSDFTKVTKKKGHVRITVK